MTWIHPVIAITLALLFGAILVGAVGWRHPRRPGGAPSLLFLLLLLFPFIWTAALWSAPVGPTVLGVAIVPAVMLGLLVTMVIAVLHEPRPAAATEAAEADAVVAVFGLTFWLLLVLAAGAIVVGYLV